MQQFLKINWYETDINELYDILYNEIEEGEQYNYFEYLMQHFPDLDIDWLEIFEGFKEELLNNDKIETYLSFAEWFRLKNPIEYCERYECIEKELCDYFLHKKDVKKLMERIAFIQQNPLPGPEKLTVRLLYQLIFHGYFNQAISYAETIWKGIKESKQDNLHSAFPFIKIIYANELQKYYEASLSGKYIDQELLYNQFLEMGFEDKKASFFEVLLTLNENITIDDIPKNSHEDKIEQMLYLNINFLKHMLNTYQLPFVFSESIWDFIASTALFGQQRDIDDWFYIDIKTLDMYLARILDTHLWSNDLEIFGKVWHLNFVFDYLYQQRLLSSEQYENMIENVSYIRKEMIRILGDRLWQMAFVFNTTETNNHKIEIAEKQLFNKTFQKNYSETAELVKNYLSTYRIPIRIQKELKINYSKIENHYPFWQENKPFVRPEIQIGRNDLCICGSGKKYKKCCMND